MLLQSFIQLSVQHTKMEYQTSLEHDNKAEMGQISMGTDYLGRVYGMRVPVLCRSMSGIH